MVRELADFDPQRAREVLTWPLREGLLAYIERIKGHELQRYDVACLIWASIAPYSKREMPQPQLPPILRRIDESVILH